MKNCFLERKDESQSSSRSPLFAFQVLLGAVAAGLVITSAINGLIAYRTPRLGPRLSGYFGRYPARFGDLAYVVAGTGTPVLLLHGLEAGRTMAEWRAVFDLLARNHTVYAFDWQGFGMSDANMEGYRANDFAEQLSAFIRDLIGQNATVIAAGESAAFALMAANLGAPIQKLILVCPQEPASDEPPRQDRAEALMLSEGQKRLLNAPIVGAALINWYRRTEAIKHFVNEFGLWNKAQVESETRLLHIAAHQNGAERAQRAFWEGCFACDWRQAWKENSTPTLLIWGRHARGFDSVSEWLALRPDANLEVIENALLLPHLDQPTAFAELVEEALAPANAGAK